MLGWEWTALFRANFVLLIRRGVAASCSAISVWRRKELDHTESLCILSDVQSGAAQWRACPAPVPRLSLAFLTSVPVSAFQLEAPMQFASAASTVLSPLNLIFSVAVLSGVSEACFADITIGTVAIGNAGNASDPITARGAVSYAFNIGATEVTNAQYAAFLNAKAATDTYSLYNTEMAGTYGGINRSGTAGSYTYSTVSGRADNPVNFVSYWDSLRFANWLHNGQGSGATETGAYTLTSSGISANSIARNSDWRWAVTSDNEWYKAAYHQPASEGGPSDNYWLYPMGTDSIPSDSEANINNVVGNTVAVGSYAANFYGTFDMAGNVMEWTEAAMTSSFGSYRFLRGGSFTNYYGDIRSNWYFYEVPTAEDRRFGFRVSQIPSPASFALLSLGMLGPRGRRSRAAR